MHDDKLVLQISWNLRMFPHSFSFDLHSWRKSFAILQQFKWDLVTLRHFLHGWSMKDCLKSSGAFRRLLGISSHGAPRVVGMCEVQDSHVVTHPSTGTKEDTVRSHPSSGREQSELVQELTCTFRHSFVNQSNSLE